MEFIDGLDFKAFARGASQEDKNRAASAIHRFAYECTMRLGVISADPHPGNFLFLKDGRVAFLDFGRAVSLGSGVASDLREFFTAIHEGDMERTKALMRRMQMVRDWERFPFDEFWEIQTQQMRYELADEPVRFDHRLLREIFRIGRSFKERHLLTMEPKFFWPVFSSVHYWGLYAELGAECHWRTNARKAMGLQ
jgi:predicted unusual protein kinase regulating ubiquinone biosynthesis (AarF/ABC1/UbiB family)